MNKGKEWERMNMDWVQNFQGPLLVILYNDLVENTEKELRRMQEKKYGHEESKADDLDPAHRQLIDDATPSSDLEHGHMELVMNKMRYASLGVENGQLRAQIAERKAMNRLAEEGVPSAPE